MVEQAQNNQQNLLAELPTDIKEKANIKSGAYVPGYDLTQAFLDYLLPKDLLTQHGGTKNVAIDFQKYIREKGMDPVNRSIYSRELFEEWQRQKGFISPPPTEPEQPIVDNGAENAIIPNQRDNSMLKIESQSQPMPRELRMLNEKRQELSRLEDFIETASAKLEELRNLIQEATKNIPQLTDDIARLQQTIGVDIFRFGTRGSRYTYNDNNPRREREKFGLSEEERERKERLHFEALSLASTTNTKPRIHLSADQYEKLIANPNDETVAAELKYQFYAKKPLTRWDSRIEELIKKSSGQETKKPKEQIYSGQAGRTGNEMPPGTSKSSQIQPTQDVVATETQGVALEPPTPTAATTDNIESTDATDPEAETKIEAIPMPEQEYENGRLVKLKINGKESDIVWFQEDKINGNPKEGEFLIFDLASAQGKLEIPSGTCFSISEYDDYTGNDVYITGGKNTEINISDLRDLNKRLADGITYAICRFATNKSEHWTIHQSAYPKESGEPNFFNSEGEKVDGLSVKEAIALFKKEKFFNQFSQLQEDGEDRFYEKQKDLLAEYLKKIVKEEDNPEVREAIKKVVYGDNNLISVHLYMDKLVNSVSNTETKRSLVEFGLEFNSFKDNNKSSISLLKEIDAAKASYLDNVRKDMVETVLKDLKNANSYDRWNSITMLLMDGYYSEKSNGNRILTQEEHKNMYGDFIDQGTESFKEFWKNSRESTKREFLIFYKAQVKKKWLDQIRQRLPKEIQEELKGPSFIDRLIVKVNEIVT